MPPLKSAELHRLARADLGPRFLELGFRRTPKVSFASWTRPEGVHWLHVWFQPSQSNDRFSPGFSFTVEFRLSDVPSIAGGYRQRLAALLSDVEREELRALENSTVAKLPPPDPALTALFQGEDRERFLRRWKPRTTPYEPGEDPWFRQADEEDARALMAFFRRVIPAALERFLERASRAS